MGAPALLSLRPNRALWTGEMGGFGAVVRMVAQEKPEDQDPSQEPSSSQVSHLCAQLLPAARANGHSPLLQAPACQLQLYLAFLVEPRRAKQKLNFSATCSPRPPLLLLLFPTAGVPRRWAGVLNTGEHHHGNLTPKQPQK